MIHLPLATSHGDVDESASVCDSLLRAALWRLLLLLRLDLHYRSESTQTDSQLKRIVLYLWCLRLDLAGTRERAVDLTHGCGLWCSGV